MKGLFAVLMFSVYALVAGCGEAAVTPHPTHLVCVGSSGEACRVYGPDAHCIEGNTGRAITAGCCPSECAPFASTSDEFWCYEGGLLVMEGQPPPCPPRVDAGQHQTPQQ